MGKFNVNVEKMTEAQAKEVLKKIIEALDNLDDDDYFGTEGWKHFMGFED
jgi:hypothetical protein